MQSLFVDKKVFKTRSLVHSGGLGSLKSNCNYGSVLAPGGPPTLNLKPNRWKRDALCQSFIFFFRDREGGREAGMLLLLCPFGIRIERTAIDFTSAYVKSIAVAAVC